MKMIGPLAFPETQKEGKIWKRVVRYYALDSNVLAVATTRIEGTWKAYCGSVPGDYHCEESQEVLRTGTQIYEPIARIMFPEFKDIPYAE